MGRREGFKKRVSDHCIHGALCLAIITSPVSCCSRTCSDLDPPASSSVKVKEGREAQEGEEKGKRNNGRAEGFTRCVCDIATRVGGVEHSIVQYSTVQYY